MRWPLRYQIMLPMAALMLTTVMAIGGVGAWLSARAAQSRIESQIASVTRILAASNFPLTDAVLGQMKALSGADMILVSKQGRVISSSRPAEHFAELLAVAPSTNDPEFALGDQMWVRNRGYFHTLVPLGPRASDAGATLHLLYPEEEYRRAWQRAVVPSLGFVLLALPVAMLLSAATASKISSRMSRLQAQVDRIAEGDFYQLATGERDDEISALGQAVNRMAAMLARYEDDIRRTERMRTLAQLGGGIAHQLRNSVTGCSMALDLHAQECIAADSSEALEVAKRQLCLMEQHIQRFLQLGRPSEARTNEIVDLIALVDEFLPLVTPAANHAQVELRFHHAPGKCSVVGNSASLAQLVINLLLNAIEAAAQGSIQSNCAARVFVEIAAPSLGTVSLTVSDTGPGPKESISEELFEPFMSEKIDGVGLGLFVARQVVEQHGGQIRWRRSEGMTYFIVKIPACQRDDRTVTIDEPGSGASSPPIGKSTLEMQRV